MPITFEQIQKANEGLRAIDVKGKRYVMVNEKVKAFRTLFPEGFIHTDIISLENGVVVMQSKAGYYEKDGTERILGTGLAFERQDSSFINKTSFIENCETSSIGRALSFLYLGADDSIASAEELANAIKNQNQPEQKSDPSPAPDHNFIRSKPNNAPATVSVKQRIPSGNPVKDYIANELTFMKEMFNIASTPEMLEKFEAMRQKLIEAEIIEDVPSDKQTMEQAKAMIDAIYKNFLPSGDAA